MKKNFLIPTIETHADFVASWAYRIAAQEAKLRDSYVLLYIKKKPTLMPTFFYNWIIKKIVATAEFKNSISLY